ncbi:MAG: zinc-dependent peptidase [Saprospiraceae bacterium]|nr:zinc-dependent peptidase [Saprospiraceae bacterium]
MFANALITPFALLTLVFFYLAWQVDGDYSRWVIPFLVITALIYILKPEINWWWYRRRPPQLTPDLSRLLERFCRPYQRLDAPRQQLFRERVALFCIATDWTPMAWQEDNVPQDVQTALAAQAVAITLGRADFLFEPFEKVIVYPGPFPTQVHPVAHASELYEPDGCLLFSAEQVMMAFTQPEQWFNVALYEYARAFVHLHPAEAWPDFSGAERWSGLEQASRMPKTHVESLIGLPDADALAVAIHHYFNFQESFTTHLPEAAAAFQQIFPVNYTVMQIS